MWIFQPSNSLDLAPSDFWNSGWFKNKMKSYNLKIQFIILTFVWAYFFYLLVTYNQIWAKKNSTNKKQSNNSDTEMKPKYVPRLFLGLSLLLITEENENKKIMYVLVLKNYIMVHYCFSSAFLYCVFLSLIEHFFH